MYRRVIQGKICLMLSAATHSVNYFEMLNSNPIPRVCVFRNTVLNYILNYAVTIFNQLWKGGEIKMILHPHKGDVSLKLSLAVTIFTKESI